MDHNTRTTSFIDPRLPTDEGAADRTQRSRVMTESAVTGRPQVGRLLRTRGAQWRHNTGGGAQGAALFAVPVPSARAQGQVEAQRQVVGIKFCISLTCPQYCLIRVCSRYGCVGH